MTIALTDRKPVLITTLFFVIAVAFVSWATASPGDELGFWPNHTTLLLSALGLLWVAFVATVTLLGKLGKATYETKHNALIDDIAQMGKTFENGMKDVHASLAELTKTVAIGTQGFEHRVSTIEERCRLQHGNGKAIGGGM